MPFKNRGNVDFRQLGVMTFCSPPPRFMRYCKDMLALRSYGDQAGEV